MPAESSAQLGRATAERPVRAAVEITGWSISTLLGLLTATAVVVAWRRLAGALRSPLEPLMLLSAGITAAVAASSVRALWRRQRPIATSIAARVDSGTSATGYASAAPLNAKNTGKASGTPCCTNNTGLNSTLDWTLTLLPSACVVTLGISLSVPGTAAGALWTFWILLAAAEFWNGRLAVVRWLRISRGRVGQGRENAGGASQTGQPSRNSLSVESGETATVAPPMSLREKCGLVLRRARLSISSHPNPLPEGEGTKVCPLPEGEGTELRPFPAGQGTALCPRAPVRMAAADMPAGEVLQQLTRSQAADGSEELSGWTRTAFAAGQRTQSVHLAFCPPFARTPKLAVEQIDGPEARIKTAQLLPYGARLELKLAATAEQPADVLLQFSARAPMSPLPPGEG